MIAVQYRRGVIRFLATRFGGRLWESICTSPVGTTRLVDLPEPPLPSPRWARVRPSLSGICGSDLATITAGGSTYFSPFTSCPFVLGHEVVGEVVETGTSVTEVAVGDRVVLEPPLHCRVRGLTELCAECRAGRRAQCRNVTRGNISAGVQTGFCRDTGGGWSSAFVAHQMQLHKVPHGLGDEEAVLIEPFSCCLQAVASAGPLGGQTILVVGSGTIGVFTIAAIKQLQPETTVIAVAKYAHQKEWAQRLGADQVLQAGSGLYEELAGVVGAELFQPEMSKPIFSGGVDVCFDCVGSGSSIDDCLRFASCRGRVVLVGMPGIPKGIDWTSVWYKELQVVGSYTSTSPIFRRTLDVVTGLAPQLQGVVGARFPLDRFPEALRCARHSGRAGVLKTVLQPLSG
jgi:L-iditol 2-dehydrogenase